MRDGLGDRGLGSNRLPDTLSRRPSLVRHAHDGWGESRCGGVGWCDTLGDYGFWSDRLPDPSRFHVLGSDRWADPPCWAMVGATPRCWGPIGGPTPPCWGPMVGATPRCWGPIGGPTPPCCGPMVGPTPDVGVR